jgi:4-amino-4-deoxy-L-arabinose transferase-like glycosyltransferase
MAQLLLNIMKIKLPKKLLLVLILLIAAFLRLYKLSTIPPHLTPDEASLGYNAYSILKTGRDEYGTRFPIIFKSFGDYKPGLYVYFTVPSIMIFGLNEFAVRFPSAFFGILSVYLIYLLSKEIFKKERYALLSSLLFSLMPWAIYFSRGAWEVNVSLSFTLLGTLFFLKSLKNQKYILLSATFFAFTLLCYQGAKLSSSIVIILLTITNWKKIFSLKKKYLFGSLGLGILVSLSIIISLFNGKTGRLNVFSVFSYKRPQEYLQNQLSQGAEKVGDFSYYLFHSEFYNTVRGIFGRWFNHFSARFLFFEGDWSNPRHSAPSSGVLTLADSMLLILGLILVFRGKIERNKLFILLWFILASLPAILSRDQVHAVRSLNMSVPLVLILSFGLDYLFDIQSKFKNIILIIFVGVYSLSYIYFIDSYFVHLPVHDSKYWEYGYKQIVETVTPIQNNFKTIKVQQSYAQPYIYFLFYHKYDPLKYQNNAKLKESEYGDVGQVERLDNIYFAPIDWSINRGEKGTLFVADTVRIPPEDSNDPTHFNVISEIKYLNNRDIAFRIIEIK